MSTVDRPVSRSRWTRVALLLFLVFLFAFIDRTNISVAAIPMTKDMGISKVQMGALLSSFFWGYVITSIPGGYLASIFRAKWIVVVAMVIWGILSGLTGYMTSLSSLTFVRFLMGLAEGVVFPTILVVINRWFPGTERARAVNLIESGAPLSSVIMAPIAGWMIAQWNWHVMFYLQAIPPLILAVLVAIFVSDDPARDRFISAEEKQYLLDMRAVDEESEKARNMPKGSMLAIFASPKIWLLAIIYLFLLSGLYAFGLWVPTVLNAMTHRGITAVGLLTAIPFIFSIIVMYILSRSSDRTGKRAGYVIWPLVIGGAAFVVGRFTSNVFLDFVLLCIGCAGCYGPLGSWWSWSMEQVSNKHVGGTVGFINFSGNFGGIIGPIVVSLAATGTTLYSGFYILGVVMVVGGVMAWLINKRNVTVNLSGHSVAKVRSHG